MAAVFVVVPVGWERDVLDGGVIYKSPDMKTLRNREELLVHLTSDGTCKCGLRCPFQLEDQFSFDPLVLSLPDNGVPVVAAQASCKIGHSLLSSNPESGVARPPLQLRGAGKQRNARGGRNPSHEKSISLSVQPLGTKRVIAIGNDLSQKLLHSKQSSGVKKSPEGGARGRGSKSPTKRTQTLTEMSVRGLLSRIPEKPSSVHSRGKVRPETEERGLPERKQAVSKMELRLLQTQREMRDSEKSAPALSAVLTGSDVAKTMESGRGVGGATGGEEEEKEECELTVSIKLGDQRENKNMTVGTGSGSTCGKNLPESGSENGGMGNGGMETQESESVGEPSQSDSTSGQAPNTIESKSENDGNSITSQHAHSTLSQSHISTTHQSHTLTHPCSPSDHPLPADPTLTPTDTHSTSSTSENPTVTGISDHPTLPSPADPPSLAPSGDSEPISGDNSGVSPFNEEHSSSPTDSHATSVTAETSNNSQNVCSLVQRELDSHLIAVPGFSALTLTRDTVGSEREGENKRDQFLTEFCGAPSDSADLSSPSAEVSTVGCVLNSATHSELVTVQHIREALAVKQNGCGHLDDVGGAEGVALVTPVPQKFSLISQENDVFRVQPRLHRSLQSLPLLPPNPPTATQDLETPPKTTPTAVEIDDANSPAVSDLSSLTPDSAHLVQLSGSPASSPRRWTPQRSEVTIRECRVNLRPLGRGWAGPGKRAIAECEPLSREEGERQLGFGDTVPRKKLKLSEENGDSGIRGSDPFPDARPVDQSIVSNPDPPVVSNPPIGRPELPNLERCLVLDSATHTATTLLSGLTEEALAEENNLESCLVLDSATHTATTLLSGLTEEALTEENNLESCLVLDSATHTATTLLSGLAEEALTEENIKDTQTLSDTDSRVPATHSISVVETAAEGLNGGAEGLNGGTEGLNGGAEGLNGACTAVDGVDRESEIDGELKAKDKGEVILNPLEGCVTIETDSRDEDLLSNPPAKPAVPVAMVNDENETPGNEEFQPVAATSAGEMESDSGEAPIIREGDGFGWLHILALVAANSSPDINHTPSLPEGKRGDIIETAKRVLEDTSETAEMVLESVTDVSSGEAPQREEVSQPKRGWRKRRSVVSESDASCGRSLGRDGRRRLRVWRSKVGNGRRVAVGNHQQVSNDNSGERERESCLEGRSRDTSAAAEGGDIKSESLSSEVREGCVKTGDIVVEGDKEVVPIAGGGGEKDHTATSGTTDDAVKDGAKEKNLTETEIDPAKNLTPDNFRVAPTDGSTVGSSCEKGAVSDHGVATQGGGDESSQGGDESSQGGDESSLVPLVVTSLQVDPPSASPDATLSGVSECQVSCDVDNITDGNESGDVNRSHDTDVGSHDLLDGLAVKRVRVWRGGGRRGRGRKRMHSTTKCDIESSPTSVDQGTTDLESNNQPESSEQSNEGSETKFDSTNSSQQSSVPPNSIPPEVARSASTEPSTTNSSQQSSVPPNSIPPGVARSASTEPSTTPGQPARPQKLTVSVPLSQVELVHHQMLECYSTSQFQPGYVVWAKAAQLPAWPGLVIRHTDWERDTLKPAPRGKRWVRWYGDDTVSLVGEKSMKPLGEGLRRRMMRKTTKELQRAIKLALKAQQKQVQNV